MTTYPARVVEIPPRHDPDHHPPESVLAQEEAGGPQAGTADPEADAGAATSPPRRRPRVRMRPQVRQTAAPSRPSSSSSSPDRR